MRFALPMALALLALAAAPALADGAGYVALGDSYSSGVGTRTYYPEDGSCHRSPKAYPVLVAVRLGVSLGFTACSGATSGDVLSEQLWPLSRSTGYVSVSIGGNDAGFKRVLAACAAPWPFDCASEITRAQSYIRDELPAQLENVFAAIRSRAPGARVAVAGYPRLFNGRDCGAATFFSPAEETRLNRAADLLATTESSVANRFGFRFVDPRAAFAGHAACDPIEWVNGLSSPVTESFHPNLSGQADGYAPLVYGALR